jgi:hypothetical protein
VGQGNPDFLLPSIAFKLDASMAGKTFLIERSYSIFQPPFHLKLSSSDDLVGLPELPDKTVFGLPYVSSGSPVVRVSMLLDNDPFTDNKRLGLRGIRHWLSV